MKSFINCVWRLASLWASDVSDEVGSLAGSESGSSVGEISERVLNGLDPCKICVLVFELVFIEGGFYSKVLLCAKQLGHSNNTWFMGIIQRCMYLHLYERISSKVRDVILKRRNQRKSMERHECQNELNKNIIR